MKGFLLTLLPCLHLFSLAQSVPPNPLLSYQGRLSADSASLTAKATVQFRFFSGETNEVSLYEEEQVVDVREGLFSTEIGRSPTLGSLEEITKGDDSYLELTVNGKKLTPRQKYSAPPFAKRSTETWQLFYHSLSAANPNLFAFSGHDDGNWRFGWSALHRLYSSNSTALACFPPSARKVRISGARFMPLIPSNDHLDPNDDGNRVLQAEVSLELRDADGISFIRRIGSPLTLSVDPTEKTWLDLPLPSKTADLEIKPGEILCYRMTSRAPYRQDIYVMYRVDVR